MNVLQMEESVTSDINDGDMNIRVVNNRVYFYEDINEKSILKLTSTLDKLSSHLINLKNDYSLSKTPKIYLHIQSYGGDVFSGLSGMNSIENNKVPVVTIVDGFVASAATLLFLGGKRRRMQKNAHFLIHQVRGEFWGKHDELKDEYKNSKNLMRIIKQIYKAKSNMDSNAISTIIVKERYMNADECLKYELIDEIC